MPEQKLNVTTLRPKLQYGHENLDTLAERAIRGEITFEYAEKVLTEAARVLEIGNKAIEAEIARRKK